jgi:hypothetical protein
VHVEAAESEDTASADIGWAGRRVSGRLAGNGDMIVKGVILLGALSERRRACPQRPRLISMAQTRDSPVHSDELQLTSLGTTPQGALRHLVDEFERRGWRDDGSSALAVVRLLESSGGAASWRKVVDAVPRSFLAINQVRRRDLESALREAATLDR